MAQSFFGKVKILLSASLHSLVDRALESNSVGVFDEYIRQAEGSMEAVRNALIDLSATVKTLKRKYDETSKDAAKLDLEIDQLLKTGKTIAAKAAQSQLNNKLDIARTYQDQYEKQNAAYQMLIQIVDVLQSKVDSLKSQRDQVATLIQLVKSKGIIAKSMNDVSAITDDKTSAIVEKVKSQLDMQDARLEAATSRLSDQIENAVGDASLDAQLEERRQRLGLG